MSSPIEDSVSFRPPLEATLADIDRALDESSKTIERDLASAARHAAGLRDAIIAELRSSSPSEGRLRPLLEKVNVGLSILASVEYPLKGIHRKSLQTARSQFREIAAQLDDATA